MLSVGRLCEFAEKGPPKNDTVEGEISIFCSLPLYQLLSDGVTEYDRRLDFIAVLEGLRAEMEAVLKSQPVKHDDIEAKTSVAVDEMTKSLAESGRAGCIQVSPNYGSHTQDTQQVGISCSKHMRIVS